MEFRFSDEEEDLRSAVADFAQKELVEKDFDRSSGLPRHLVKQMGDLGFFSLGVPEDHGGEPATWVDIGILVEEIAKGDIALALLSILSYQVSLLLSEKAEKQLAEKWVPRLVTGQKLGSMSVTEPTAGSDLMTMVTAAARDGDGYRISGEKCPVSFGMEADFTILCAPTMDNDQNAALTLFLVPLDLAGVTRSPVAVTGIHASAPASLILDNVTLPAEYRLGGEGEGTELLRKYGLRSDIGRILCGLACLGLGQTALKLAMSYSRERVAFRRPISQFEAISARIAEDATLVEAGKWLCYRALSLKDRGLPNMKEAAMCGWWCAQNAYQVIEDALLIHGHAGYSDDHPFQQMLRDVLAFQMIPGTKQLLQLAVAREVIGDVAIPREMNAAARKTLSRDIAAKGAV
jgi:cyclohexanecarboxyl-CoA dehydrogenase